MWAPSCRPLFAPQVRKLRDEHHQKTLGIQLAGAATFDRQAIADHAINLASTVKGNLQRSLESLGVVGGVGRLARRGGGSGGGPGGPAGEGWGRYRRRRGHAAAVPSCH